LHKTDELPTHNASNSSPPLEEGPLNPVRGSGERCRLPQWGLGRSLSRNRIGHLASTNFM